MPPQDPPTGDPLPSPERWRQILQDSFIGPLTLASALDQGRDLVQQKQDAQDSLASVLQLSDYSADLLPQYRFIFVIPNLAQRVDQRG